MRLTIEHAKTRLGAGYPRVKRDSPTQNLLLLASLAMMTIQKNLRSCDKEGRVSVFGKPTPVWDGRRLSLSDLEAPLAVCSCEGVVFGLSPSAARIFELVGMSFSKLPAPLPKQLRKILERAGPGTQVDWRASGSSHCIGVTYHCLGHTHWVLSLREITDHKITLSQNLYRSTQQVFARLLLGTAHDLRSPLSSMTFNVEVLRDRWRSMSEGEIDSMLEQISLGCQRELNAVEALLGAVRPPSSGQISLGVLFDRIQAMLRPLFRSGSNRLQLDVEREIEVRGTPLTLQHVFVNLLNNACEASTKSTTVSVSSRREAQQVVLDVVDDGPGIPNGVWEHVFDPFYTTKRHGSGLGLCLAREAVREVGGDLLLHPFTGRGAHFEVQLALGTPLGEVA
jgi:signal transduction histidine kinase